MRGQDPRVHALRRHAARSQTQGEGVPLPEVILAEPRRAVPVVPEDAANGRLVLGDDAAVAGEGLVGCESRTMSGRLSPLKSPTARKCHSPFSVGRRRVSSAGSWGRLRLSEPRALVEHFFRHEFGPALRRATWAVCASSSCQRGPGSVSAKRRGTLIAARHNDRDRRPLRRRRRR
jgi:hypothetical protein